MNDSEIKNRIIEKARDYFFKHGYLKVTMDEIAHELGMSKKTLYQNFSGKDDLLKTIMQCRSREMDCMLDKIIQDQQQDFVEKLKSILKYVGVKLSQLDTAFLQDLKRNAPEIWKEMSAWHEHRIFIECQRLITEGMERGVFRNDIDQETVVLMYAYAIEQLIQPEIASKLPLTMNQIFETIIKVVLEGIFTDQARINYRSIDSSHEKKL